MEGLQNMEILQNEGEYILISHELYVPYILFMLFDFVRNIVILISWYFSFN